VRVESFILDPSTREREKNTREGFLGEKTAEAGKEKKKQSFTFPDMIKRKK